MKKSFLLAAVVMPALVFGEELDPKGLGFDPFVPFNSISKSELCPPNAGLSISPEGHLLWNGRPKYFTATIWYGATEFECREDTPGYVDELKWLYQAMPGYEQMQRIGLDAGGVEAPINWTKKYAPWNKDQRRDDKTLAPAVTNGLPIYVDFTCSEWGHGWMGSPRFNLIDPEDPGDPKDGRVTGEKGRLPKEAFVTGGHHFMPYSILHPKGRKIWLTMWEEGAKECLNLSYDDKGTKVPVKFRPWCYELMNEPACFEESEWGKADFKKRMEKSYGEDWEKKLGGKAWAIEYTKYIEERFASILWEGQDAIRRLDPAAHACVQPTTMRTRGIDLYKSNEKLGVVGAPTGGHGGAVEAHLLRALADGKPIVDSEMYVGGSTNSICQAFLDQYQRGYSVSYMFKWSRRPSDWRAVHQVEDTEGKWKGTKFWRMWPEESLKKVGKVSAYNFLCPYKVATDQLLGIRLAKRKIQDVEDFFTPRNRGVKREVAVLFSSPTERLGQCGGSGNFRLFDAAVSGIDYAHLNPDVIFEPQLTNTLARLNRYKVLVMAGVSATYPGTWTQIKKWVEAGGRLAVFCEKADLNEYGEKNPEALELKEGMVKLGNGSVSFFNEKLGAIQMAAEVARLGEGVGVKPCCEALDALKDDGTAAGSVEIIPAQRGKLNAYIITSRAPSIQVVRFKPAPLPGTSKPILVCLTTKPGEKAVDGADPRVRDLVAHRQPLQADKDGYYIITLGDGSQFYVYGGQEDVLARYPRSPDVAWDEGVTAEQALADGKRRIEEEKAHRAARMPVFDVDPNRLCNVRLHEFANIQSPEFKIPWGEYDCRGVRFDFIRYDQNQFKDIIRLDNPVKDIPVEQRATNVYFLHSLEKGPKSANGKALTYSVTWEDDSKLDVPVRDGKEIASWKGVKDFKPMREVGTCRGWTTDDDRGFYLWQWKNPKPELKIKSIAAAAAEGSVPVIAGITVEKPAPKTVYIEKLICKGGAKGVKAHVDATNGTWYVYLDETAGSWCTASCDISPSVPCSPGKYTRLYFEMNRLPDAYGNYHDHATPQFKINGRTAEGKLVFGGWRVAMYKRGGWAYRADNDPDTWETVWIGMDKGVQPDYFAKIISIALQFQMMPAEHSGLAFRNFRFEEGE